MWLIGIPWQEAGAAAALMGTKTVLNEFVAYLNFAALPVDAFTPHTRLILTYALCGFANFGSAGIMVGGIGMMIPDRRAEVVPARYALDHFGHAGDLHEWRGRWGDRVKRRKVRALP